MTISRQQANVILAVVAILCAGEVSRRGLAAGAGDQRAPQRLEETGLYDAGRFGVVAAQNRPFSPQYPLWSDGAIKARWVYLPPGAAIDATDVGEWVVPVGTRFWKEFSFGDRKVETRFLWRASEEQWVLASYLWNEAQTEAVLAPEDGVFGVADVAPGKRHTIPSVADCRACHESQRVEPLGFNALQLSTDRDPGAIHGEPLAPGMLTLETLDGEELLRPARPELVANPPRIRTEHPRTRSVLGYLAANCGTCHNRDGDTTALVPSLRHADVLDGDRVARALVGHPTAWQVPGVPEGTSVLVDRHTPETSALLTRMRSRRPSTQMPPLGTIVADGDAIRAVDDWIRNDLAKVEGGPSVD